MIQSILTICVGNICRSPMAEAFFISRLKHQEPQIKVSSAGINALVDKSSDSVAQELMQKRGLDISSHQARQVSPQMLLEAGIIFTMTAGQQREIECTLPSIRGRVHRLGHWGGYDVPDPYRRPKEVFEQVLALIEQGVEDWCLKLWN